MTVAIIPSSLLFYIVRLIDKILYTLTIYIYIHMYIYIIYTKIQYAVLYDLVFCVLLLVGGRALCHPREGGADAEQGVRCGGEEPPIYQRRASSGFRV